MLFGAPRLALANLDTTRHRRVSEVDQPITAEALIGLSRRTAPLPPLIALLRPLIALRRLRITLLRQRITPLPRVDSIPMAPSGGGFHGGGGGGFHGGGRR